MQPQLFLFDQEDVFPGNGIKEGKAFALPGEPEKEREEAPDPENTEATAGEDLAVREDPFAGVQQRQQDKVDMLLLMPNKKRGRKSFRDMDEESILIAVPEDEDLFKKQYYPTRVVAEWFGITASQLRLWENEFDILTPKKNAKGDRFFRPEDVKNLKLIYHLIRIRKFTVQGAKQYLEENKKRLQTTLQLTESLTRLRQFLLELKAISG